jgi:hypothetical protein
MDLELAAARVQCLAAILDGYAALAERSAPADAVEHVLAAWRQLGSFWRPETIPNSTAHVAPVEGWRIDMPSAVTILQLTLLDRVYRLGAITDRLEAECRTYPLRAAAMQRAMRSALATIDAWGRMVLAVTRPS